MNLKKLFGRDKPRIPKVSREHPIGVGVPEVYDHVEPVNMNQQTRVHSEERIGGSEDSQIELTNMIGRCFSSGARGSVTPQQNLGCHFSSIFPASTTCLPTFLKEVVNPIFVAYLTATASEDWVLVLEVCDRACATENNAKEAVRALRREFK